LHKQIPRARSALEEKFACRVPEEFEFSTNWGKTIKN
jgi:hypothetical protein